MKQKQNQQQKKFIRPRNIILILLTLCCFGGCQYFSLQQDKGEAVYLERLDSLTELTTTAQILDAVKAQEKRMYVINNYQFPKYTLAKDPYHKTTKECVYISVSVSTEGSDGKMHDDPNLHKTAYGSLSFDDNTPLLDFNNSDVNIAGTGIKKERPDYTYYYATLKPDAKLSFIALLGGGEARLSGFDGKRCIAEGEKKRLAEQDGDYTKNFLLKIACIIAGILAGLFVFADYLTIKEKEQKRAERQRSKQGKKK
ncbi:MAG: hypothetical protein K6A78_01635 [Prevotella sp.]|nr:hypothetical protein [Prevotella sp.]